MLVRYSPFAILLTAGVLALPPAPAVNKKTTTHEETIIRGPGTLWREPTDIASRDLYWGPGGEEHRPRPPFRFDKEDLEGSSPKFTVTDQDGVKWKVKLGQEARSETAAARLTWSVGFFTNEDYLLPVLRVEGMPQLRRGQKLVAPDGSMYNARLKRQNKDEKKLGIWAWRDETLASRQLNALKVVMALLDNWDLKDENNAVYQERGERIFLVSDLGASFGTPGRSWPRSRAKDNLKEYRRAAFIRYLTDETIDFATPARPRFVYLLSWHEYFQRIHLESLGRNIPRQDAWWIGQLLGCLSPKQIRDAFRAGGYSPAEVEQFAQVTEGRIAQLTRL
jgi:hypothetical protein